MGFVLDTTFTVLYNKTVSGLVMKNYVLAPSKNLKWCQLQMSLVSYLKHTQLIKTGF